MNVIGHALLISALTLNLCAANDSGLPETNEVRLSSLNLRLAKQTWGKPAFDRSVEGHPLSIAGRKYRFGCGTHAPSEVFILLNGGSSRFTASVGLDDEGGRLYQVGSVEFLVEGDGKVLWRSPIMRAGMEAVPVDVDLSGVQKLTLRVTDAGDGNSFDHADWADAVFLVTGRSPVAEQPPLPSPRWKLGQGMTTVWPVVNDARLPHEDFIEQGGLRAGQVVRYSIDSRRVLAVRRTMVWPGLRVHPNDPNSTLMHTYQGEANPVITMDGTLLKDFTVNRVILDGGLTFEGTLGEDLALTRRTFPSTTAKTALDIWSLRNTGKTPHTVETKFTTLVDREDGPHGTNVMEVTCNAPVRKILSPGHELSFAVLFSARLEREPEQKINVQAEDAARSAYFASIQGAPRLETPIPEFNQAFGFSKLRVAESISATRSGLMLSPGGLSYYAVVWCNDNFEYAGPFFPFLGDTNGNQASLDTFRLYKSFMRPDYGKIPSLISAEVLDDWSGEGDRGDAAMYAYGCARFCLAYGDRAVAEELWPAIAWCLEYSRRQLTPDGVVASDSDEMGGRLPTGRANLSTSCLYYGALRSAADLGRSLGKEEDANDYTRRADIMAKSIENYFGAVVDGFPTYRYYDGNDVLRSWICLPLCMGLNERRDATIAALFSPRLWMDEGFASQEGDRSFWDRSTLYGFRGALQAGEIQKVIPYLTAYTQRRLLGEHVPYAVQAWPEGDQRQSAAESALYCRVFTEGLFGILPTSLDSFRCTPRLPEGWSRMALRSIRAFHRDFDLVVERRGDKQHLAVTQSGHTILEQNFNPGESISIRLP